ncbi:MAG: cell division protein FtsQ/DivIB [Nitrospiraceae bacterium]
MRWWGGQKAAARPNRVMRPGPSVGRTGSRRGGLGLVRRVWWLAVWMAMVVSLGWAAGWLHREAGPLVAGWFQIREVTVVGAATLSRQEVVERLGLQPGETFLSVDVKKLTDRLEAHPWIKEATVSRRLPQTLVVGITERRPVAVLRTPSWALLLDADAHALSALKDSEDPGLPVLVGIDPKAFLLGTTQSREAAQIGIKVASLVGHALHDRPEVDMGHADRAVAYVKGLRFQFSPSSVEEQWDRYRRIEHALRTGIGVMQGKKIAHCALYPVQETRQQRPGNGCPEIDLRYPGKVIVRERG